MATAWAYMNQLAEGSLVVDDPDVKEVEPVTKAPTDQELSTDYEEEEGSDGGHNG